MGKTEQSKGDWEYEGSRVDEMSCSFQKDGHIKLH